MGLPTIMLNRKLSATIFRMGRSRKFRLVAVAVLAMISVASPDEWQSRHRLVPPTGVLNLTEPAQPAAVAPEVQIAAAADPAATAGRVRPADVLYEATCLCRRTPPVLHRHHPV